MNINSNISCFDLFFFFWEILSLHRLWYYLNRHTPYGWSLDVSFYWTFSIDLSMWILPFLWIVSHAYKRHGAVITNLWSSFKSVSNLYWKYYYYGLIDLVDVYTYYLLFISCEYTIQNSTGWLLVIGLHHLKRYIL